jgi:hypothetical protein
MNICRTATNAEERLRLWHTATGLAPSTFYKYYRRIKRSLQEQKCGIVES